MIPFRFLALILGPPGSSSFLLEQGRALGTLMTDQLFCQLTAYTAKTRSALTAGLNTFIQEMTVLPPAAWDPSIRLEPPKNIPSIQTRYLLR